MDPCATPADPHPAILGFPMLHQGAGATIVGPTGGGRSSLLQACLYDAARAGVRCAYLGHEVTEPEFNARAARLAALRGDPVDDELRDALAHVRYLNLSSVIAHAWEDPAAWGGWSGPSSWVCTGGGSARDTSRARRPEHRGFCA
jgi:hypothetical protein